MLELRAEGLARRLEPELSPPALSVSPSLPQLAPLSRRMIGFGGGASGLRAVRRSCAADDEPPLTLLGLPLDMLAAILAALPTSDACAALGTCRRLLRLGQEPLVWERLSLPAPILLHDFAQRLDRLAAVASSAAAPASQPLSHVRALVLRAPDAASLAKLGTLCPRVRTLVLIGEAVPPTRLVAGLANLRSLCMSDCIVGADILARIVPHAPQLEEVQLHGGVRSMRPDGAEGALLTGALAAIGGRLRKLELRWRPTSARTLVRTVASCSSLASLALVGCGLRSDSIQALLPAHALTELDLSYSPLTDALLERLVLALPLLRQLTLRHCSELRSVEALRAARRLASLDLSHCTSCSDASALASLPELAQLVIQSSPCANATLLATLSEGAHVLRALTLSCLPTPRPVRALEPRAGHAQTGTAGYGRQRVAEPGRPPALLVSLWLRGVAPRGAAHLVELVGGWRRLRSLSVDGKTLGLAGDADALLAALNVRGSALRRLTLVHCAMSSASARVLAALPLSHLELHSVAVRTSALHAPGTPPADAAVRGDSSPSPARNGPCEETPPPRFRDAAPEEGGACALINALRGSFTLQSISLSDMSISLDQVRHLLTGCPGLVRLSLPRVLAANDAPNLPAHGRSLPAAAALAPLRTVQDLQRWATLALRVAVRLEPKDNSQSVGMYLDRRSNTPATLANILHE